MFAPCLIDSIERAEALAERLRSSPPTASGFAAVRSRHMEPVLEALETGVGHFIKGGSRHDTLIASRLVELADKVRTHPAAEYVSIRNRTVIAEGRLHAFRHDWLAADRAIGDLVFRPHMACEDVVSVRTAMLLDRVVRPNLVASPSSLAALSLERLLFLMSRFITIDQRLDLIEAFGPQIAGLLEDAATLAHVSRVSGLPENVLSCFPAGLAYIRVRRPWPGRTVNPRQLLFRVRSGQPFRTILGALIELSDRRTSFALSRASLDRGPPVSPARGTLVTRGMGGAGDIVMMLPGVIARARRDGNPVHFAVPRALRPLLDGIDRIVPLVAEADLPFEDFATWINLSECPAGRYEAAARPKIIRSRVEIFAEALGVGASELNRSGWTAPFRLDARQQLIREQVQQSAERRPIVGIAPFSREEYRRVPALVAAGQRLAETSSVLVLHAHRPESLRATGLRFADTPDLASLIAVIAACDYVIATDTAQLHLALALDVPTLAVFGPTDGRARTDAHPKVRVLQPWTRCAVMPCWRNEDLACQLTLGQSSACLADLTADEVLREFDALVAAHPVTVGRVSPILSAA